MSSETAALSTTEKELTLEIGDMPLVPDITVDVQTTLVWGDIRLSVSPGTHTFPVLRMQGTQQISVSGSKPGTIEITWREGSLA